MTKHWVLHLGQDPVPVHEVPELLVVFHHLVGTEDNVFIDLAVFFHYSRIISLSQGNVTSPGMVEEHGDCFRM